MFCVRKINVLLCKQNMFERKKTNNNLFGGGGGGGIFFCLLPPFDLHFGFFKIKSLVPRTSNLRDSTDIPFKYQDNINPRYCNRKASR